VQPECNKDVLIYRLGLTPGEGFQDLGGVVNRDWGEGAGASR